MRCRCSVALLLLALASGARGQQRRTGPPSSPADSTDALPTPLYRQARETVAALPVLLQPAVLSQIGTDEMRPSSADDNTDAAADLQAAFMHALALPSSTGDASLDALRAQIKARVEEQAVAELARGGHAQSALDLTRIADIPRAPLYSQLIMALARPHRARPEAASNEPAAPPPEPADPSAETARLVRECERAAHAFPYRGVAALLRLDTPPGVDRMLLVQDGYSWAARESSPDRVEAALDLLRAGHRAEPELDAALESSLDALLRLPVQPQSVSTSDGNAAPSGVQTRLLALLTTLDPVQAAALRESSPALDALPTTVAPSLSGPIPGFHRGFATLTVPPPADSLIDPVDPADLQRFQALVGEAESLRHRAPSLAFTAAGQASDLLSPALWPSAAVEALRLAAIFQELGDAADAYHLVQHALDQADAAASGADQDWKDGDMTTLSSAATDPSRWGARALMLYSESARLEFSLTAARAAAAPFTLLKPLVLARVALVGDVVQRRLRRRAPASQ